MHLWPWNSIANPILLLLKIRWKFGALKWNHSNVRALTNKHTETDVDENQYRRFASLRSRGGKKDMNLLEILYSRKQVKEVHVYMY